MTLATTTRRSSPFFTGIDGRIRRTNSLASWASASASADPSGEEEEQEEEEVAAVVEPLTGWLHNTKPKYRPMDDTTMRR